MDSSNEEDLEKLIKKRKRYQIFIIIEVIFMVIFIAIIGGSIIQNNQPQRGPLPISEMEIMSFNSKFEEYKGIQKGSDVKTLINLVNKNNILNDISIKKISINGDQNPTDISINEDLNYIIEIEYNEEGFVSNLLVKEEQ